MEHPEEKWAEHDVVTPYQEWAFKEENLSSEMSIIAAENVLQIPTIERSPWIQCTTFVQIAQFAKRAGEATDNASQETRRMFMLVRSPVIFFLLLSWLIHQTEPQRRIYHLKWLDLQNTLRFRLSICVMWICVILYLATNIRKEEEAGHCRKNYKSYIYTFVNLWNLIHINNLMYL